MPKNITIQKKGSAQNYSGVAHIIVPSQDSGDVEFVPISDYTTGVREIVENGEYSALEDSLAGYTMVRVNVPVTAIKGKDKRTGKTVTYSVNSDTGELETEEQASLPQGIRIEVPPTKRKYIEGDTIDYTGIKVFLTDTNGTKWVDDSYPTGEIPFDELVFPVTEAEGGYTTYTEDVDISPFEGRFNFTYSDTLPWKYQGGTETTFDQTVAVTNRITYVRESGDYSVYSGFAVAASKEEFTVDGETASQVTVNGKTFYQSYIIGATMIQEAFPAINDGDDSNVTAQMCYNIAYAMLYGDTSNFEEIPVQWVRTDDTVLEDTFKIKIIPEKATQGTSSSGSGHTSGEF